MDCFKAEHRGVEKAISGLDAHCLNLIAHFYRDYFMDLSEYPEANKAQLARFFNVSEFRIIVNRLLDLGLIFTEVEGQKYAYHWSRLGKLTIAKLIQKGMLGSLS